MYLSFFLSKLFYYRDIYETVCTGYSNKMTPVLSEYHGSKLVQQLRKMIIQTIDLVITNEKD